MDDNPRPSKRARKSCERCRARKQKCHGFPVCENCAHSKEECIQPPSAIEEYNSGPNQALLERIACLEAQLAAYAEAAPPKIDTPPFNTPQAVSPTSSEDERRKNNIADIVGFLSLGGDGAYVGSSSGFALATNLGQMVQATVWNKALASTVSQSQPKAMTIADLKRNSAKPPNDDMGDRILEAYFTRVHLRYPFLDPSDIRQRHANRFSQSNLTPQDQYGTFKIYMIYAIGATMLRLTEQYDYTPPENFFMTALQYISAARESHSVHNIEAMTLLVLYNLRSPSNSGIWYMIGLAIRTCIDLGLHREAYYHNVAPYEGQLRRRLFWTVYFLERVIAVSLGRPYSIADRDIDAQMPLEIDDIVRDDSLIAQKLAVPASPTFQPSRTSSNITLGIQCFRLKRLESHIQETIYRVDRPIASLVSEINPILKMLEDWHKALPPSTPYEQDYLGMHYQKAVRLLLQPFLSILPPADARIARCLHASGQLCQIFKRLHQRDSYGHSFIGLHSVFIAGVTMCYCLFITPSLWTFSVSNDLRACSSALFVMAERTPVVKKYRDALENVIGATMEFLAQIAPPNPNPNQDPTPSSPAQTHGSLAREPQLNNINASSPAFSGAAQESYVRASPKMGEYTASLKESEGPDLAYMHEAQTSPVSNGRWEGRHGELGQMDAEWLLGLCEGDGDGFNLQMLNEMMRFEPSLGA
ncbi:putative transcriptional regulatory protein [Lachnellula hyalina]|uniref:Putative transcriptional regulatory protein n=1 Tax=Lachnellula hyalina TaxID=1316788 RepID=A0A8H8R1S2_9HELO|nr:putative transcriptional regulatory protein [Lachnellula hyalina]TVY26180.1 putative transcriptional regulatory protein [Lachnellula hyalina]